jgi:hypothetical protein
MMAAMATAVVVVVARSVGEVSGEVSVVDGGCVLCLTPTYRRNRTRNIIFWSKLRFILFGILDELGMK